jgi:glucan-binding YG repeat protein
MKRPAAAPQPKVTKKQKYPQRKPAFEKKDEVEPAPSSSKPEENAEPEVSAEPALTNAVFKRPAAKAAPVKHPGKKANVVEMITHKSGWKVYQIKTPKGRIYPKFVRNSDKSYYFSEKQAKEAGFVQDPDCNSSGNLDEIEDVD